MYSYLKCGAQGKKEHGAEKRKMKPEHLYKGLGASQRSNFINRA